LAGKLRDRIQRTLAPRAVVALSRLRLPRLGPPRVELYFAYDDPYAAVALPGLLQLTRARGLPLRLYPLLQRGIDGDPAAQQRARYALVDADRLLQRGNRCLGRRQPLDAADCAFLAAWTQAAAGEAASADFAAAALDRLWLQGGEPVEPQPYAALYRDILGRKPAADSPQLEQALRRNTRRLHARGHWESPAARVDGEWFFAHERLAQIAERLA
jgi:2-hydroxychromene-2-carboxylate isomerase